MPPFQTSPARQGLDLLLAFYPHHDLVSVEWQVEEEEVVHLSDGEKDISLRWGPWVLVQMGQASDGPWRSFAIFHFAIWRSTGAVHTMRGPAGPVSDDPIFTPSVNDV